MSDPHTLEVLNEIRSAANRAELFVDELRVSHREGAFGREAVGSPPYVRRLRDQAVMRILANPRPEDVEQARVVAKNNKGDFEGTVLAMLAHWAVELADAGLHALGYEPPTDQGEREDRDHADAIRTAADLLRRYRNEIYCECPPEGHHCGRPHLDRLIERIDAEVAPTGETKETE